MFTQDFILWRQTISTCRCSRRCPACIPSCISFRKLSSCSCQSTDLHKRRCSRLLRICTWWYTTRTCPPKHPGHSSLRWGPKGPGSSWHSWRVGEAPCSCNWEPSLGRISSKWVACVPLESPKIDLQISPPLLQLPRWKLQQPRPAAPESRAAGRLSPWRWSSSLRQP